MATAAELLLPLRTGLRPVPKAGQPGVCRICRSGCDQPYDQCYQCLMAQRSVGAPDILPISMSLHGALFHHHLRHYKDDRDTSVKQRLGLRLAALVAVFFQRHAACVGDFESVVLVPSTNRTAVSDIVNFLPFLRDIHRPALLSVGPKDTLAVDRFRLTRAVAGERILLLDDTFASGKSIFSAAASLRNAGAILAGPLVLGRHIQPNWPSSRELLSWLNERPWDESRCCRCDGELARPGTFL